MISFPEVEKTQSNYISAMASWKGNTKKIYLPAAPTVLSPNTAALLSSKGGDYIRLPRPAMATSSNIINQSNGIALCITISIALHGENI